MDRGPRASRAGVERRPGTSATLAIVAASAVASNAIVAAQGGRVTALGLLALAPAAVALWWVARRANVALTRVRFGRWRLHVLSFVIIMGLFWLHAAYALTFGHTSLGGGWLGLLAGMTVGWGLGLVIHTVGAWRAKGFEYVEI